MRGPPENHFDLDSPWIQWRIFRQSLERNAILCPEGSYRRYEGINDVISSDISSEKSVNGIVVDVHSIR